MKTSNTSDAVRFLALGDSYTIGERVAPALCWPVQLAEMLREQDIAVTDPQIIARTGWTTDELKAGIEAVNPQGPFDLVSLLIGVNNQYRGYPADDYRQEFAALLDRAIGFAGGNAGRVIVLSIPDWGVTPFAKGHDREQITAQIDAFNTINREEAFRRGVAYLDITPVSRNAASNADLVAADGLHPSGKMYTDWARQALPLARKLLEE